VFLNENLPHFNKKHMSECGGGGGFGGMNTKSLLQTKNFASMLKQKLSVHMLGTVSPDSCVLLPGTNYGQGKQGSCPGWHLN
jgi:hypothetical protein